MISFRFLSVIFVPVRTGISKFSFSDFGALCFIFGELFLVVYKGCFGNLSRKFLLGANSGGKLITCMAVAWKPITDYYV